MKFFSFHQQTTRGARKSDQQRSWGKTEPISDCFPVTKISSSRRTLSLILAIMRGNMSPGNTYVRSMSSFIQASRGASLKRFKKCLRHFRILSRRRDTGEGGPFRFQGSDSGQLP